MMIVSRVDNKITCSYPQAYCNNEELAEILSSLLFEVSWATAISYDELFSTSRTRDITQARYLYCFIARKNMGMFTLQQIADVFNIDHSTVVHACHNIENALQLRDSESRRLQDRYLKILGFEICDLKFES
jgi:chromosomal replication initiation ATPase DnaA